MKAISTEIRTIDTSSGTIRYTFERKEIKNINLRIRHDGRVYVSAPGTAPISDVEAYVNRKSSYILDTLRHIQVQEQTAREKQYVSGESVTYLGKNIRFQIIKDRKESVEYDGVYLKIHVKDPASYQRKKRLYEKWLEGRMLMVFTQILLDVHERFIPYEVEFPFLKLRDMTSRWGSCQPKQGSITLNKRLIEAPKNCIEYVVFHELCHFVHPNHSKEFYALLQVMLPDWRERKAILEKCITV